MRLDKDMIPKRRPSVGEINGISFLAASQQLQQEGSPSFNVAARGMGPVLMDGPRALQAGWAGQEEKVGRSTLSS